MDEIMTERLILRPFRESDCDDLCEFLYQLKDDEFEGYPDLDAETARAQLMERIGSGEYYAVTLRESGKVIGSICCADRAQQAKEVGYIINEDYRRRGYALEALTAVVRAAFRAGVHRICAECDPRNERSWRLPEAAGFRREAHLRQNVYFHTDAAGEPIWKDTYVYAMLRGDVKM